MSMDLGLFLLRVSLGILGWSVTDGPTYLNFLTLSTTFADPLGIGSMFSLALAIFAEAFCPVLLILGIKTRLAATPIAITMLVIVGLILGPLNVSNAGLTYLYLFGCLALLFTGGGKFALVRD